MARKKPVETTYWPPFYRRALYFGFGVFLLLLSIAVGWRISALPVAGQDEHELTSLWWFLCLFLSCGAGLILSAIRFRLTLTSRALTLHRALYTRTIQRKAISRYSIGNPHQGGSQRVLYLFTTSPRWFAMSVSLEFEDNAPLIEWIDGIPERR